MPLISKTDLETINLDGDEWVKIPKAFSYQDMIDMYGGDESDQDKSMKALVCCIREWNVKDGDKIAELTPENIKRLPLETISIINEKISSKIRLDKKKDER